MFQLITNDSHLKNLSSIMNHKKHKPGKENIQDDRPYKRRKQGILMTLYAFSSTSYTSLLSITLSVDFYTMKKIRRTCYSIPWQWMRISTQVSFICSTIELLSQKVYKVT